MTSPILDRNGKPFVKGLNGMNLFNSADSYLSSLIGVSLDPAVRATAPLETHAWVFSAAIMTATVASQAPLTVFRETEDQIEQRRSKAKSLGRAYRPGVGTRRRAVQRHLSPTIPLLKRSLQKGMEADYDHELQDVFIDPNPLQDGTQLQVLTDIYIQLHGHAFWVLTNEGDDEPTGNTVQRAWPVSPSQMTPVLAGVTHGALIGWQMTRPKYFETATSTVQKITIPVEDVVHFVGVPNLSDLALGTSRLGPVAGNIESDMLLSGHSRSLLKNQAVPKGVLQYDGMVSPEEEREAMRSWQEKFEGTDQAGRTAFLHSGWKYQVVGLPPTALGDLPTREWNRNEILAALNTPRSVVGVTEFMNFATQLGQDRNFWDKNLMPHLRMKEVAINQHDRFFGLRPDTEFAAFDLSGVEALRAGLIDKVTMANTMCSQNLHMPPRIAYEVVGIEVPRYEADDVAFVPPLVATVADALTPINIEPSPSDDEDDNKIGDPDEVREVANARPKTSQKATSRAKVQRQFVRLQSVHEAQMRSNFRTWVTKTRIKTLKQLTGTEVRSYTSMKMADIDIEAIIPSLLELASTLTAAARPVYAGATESAYTLVASELGVLTFQIDDEAIIRQWSQREKIFTRSVPKTVRNNLKTALLEGIRNGESIGQLRQRIGQIFDIAESAPKTLTIARTETAGLMNGVRHEMFMLQGITKTSWSTAQDEVVRPDHMVFGDSGIHNLGFNYMELVGSSGTIQHPGQVGAPAGQVIHCRCVEVAEA